MLKECHISTAAIELATGFSTELLRKWRFRYGFPKPELADGRGYSEAQLEQLRLIRRLLDCGFRPGQVVGKSARELRMVTGACLDDAADEQDELCRRALEALVRYDLEGLRALLVTERAATTLPMFISEVVAPLVQALGQAWSRNELGVHHEHLCTSVLTTLLGEELLLSRGKSGGPVVVLGTPVQESHVLGLMMAECILSDAGASCINLGPCVPANEMAMAAIGCKADILAVSFSFSYPRNAVRSWLVQMRKMLPDAMELWAGGAGTAVIRRRVPGVRLFSDLDSAHLEMRQRSGPGRR